MKIIKRLQMFFIISKVTTYVRNTAHSVPHHLREPISFSVTPTNWIVKYNIGNYNVVYTRMIRGSLIEIFLNKEIVASWVDQTKQYTVLGGINDMVYDETHLKTIYEIIKSTYIMKN